MSAPFSIHTINSRMIVLQKERFNILMRMKKSKKMDAKVFERVRVINKNIVQLENVARVMR